MTDHSPSWQASQDRFFRSNKLLTGRGRVAAHPRTAGLLDAATANYPDQHSGYVILRSSERT